MGPWAAFQKRSGGREVLAATCPGARTSPNAAPGDDELTRFALTVLCAGCRFAQVQRLREIRSTSCLGCAARLGLLIYNLWHLFLRLLEPARHVESAGGRRWFLLIAARRVQSGRQKTLQVSVSGKWWEPWQTGCQRVCARLAATAPQLNNGLMAAPMPFPLEASPA